MAKTRIVHINDSSLGTRAYESEGRRDGFAGAYEQALELAVEHDVDAVVHTGDLFDEPLPALPTVARSTGLLGATTEQQIPVYGIVGAHDRRDDAQWLNHTGTAVAWLGREPTIIGTTALYGLDTVRADDWQTTDLVLAKPPAGIDCTLLCVDELLELAGDASVEDRLEALLDRVDIDLDGIVLGGTHQAPSTRVGETPIWYTGSTEDVGADQARGGAVQLLEIEDGIVSRQHLDLESRLAGATDADGDLTASSVPEKAVDAGADAAGDDPSHHEHAVADRTGSALPTARNAIETVALRSFRERSSDADASAESGAATGDGLSDEPERKEADREEMTDGREDLGNERERLDAELAALAAAIDDSMAAIDAINADLTAAITERNVATAAFLPEDQRPATVSAETREAVASSLDSLAEERDVLSERVAMRNEALDTERNNAGSSREAVDETVAAVNRLAGRTEEATSILEDAREEQAAAQSQFEEQLSTVAAHVLRFDGDLAEGTAGDPNDVIPQRVAALQEAIEKVRGRLGELSARRAKLAADRDTRQSIDGGGTCPGCSQAVGSEHTGREVESIENTLDDVDGRLEEATQKRDALLARREKLTDLRDEMTDLRSFRSETLAEAANRVEDREANVEALQTALEAEREALADLREEREEADSAVVTIERERDGLVAEIDEVESEIDAGNACLEAFDVVEELREQLQTRLEERAELQESYDERDAELAWVDAEIEADTE